MNPHGSKKFHLSATDLTKLFKSFLLSASAAVLVTLSGFMDAVDWSSASWGPLVGAFLPFALNFVRKLLVDSRPSYEKARDARAKGSL